MQRPGEHRCPRSRVRPGGRQCLDRRTRSAATPGVARLLAERRGNVVVLSGNNRGKMDRIEAIVRARLNVLADKPWVIEPDALPKLQLALDTADAASKSPGNNRTVMVRSGFIDSSSWG